MLTFLLQSIPVMEGSEAGFFSEPLFAVPDEQFILGREDSLTILGAETDVTFGTGLASGDLDGDGRSDIVIGVPDSNLEDGEGLVMVFFAREPDEMFTLLGHHDADLIIFGEDEDDKFGTSLFIHDMDGDGKDELIIGAPFADGPSNARRDSGEVYVLSGRSRTSFGNLIDIDRTALFAHIYGRDGGDHLGILVCAGDLNDDGYPELIIRNEGYGGKADPVLSEFGNECFGSWEIEIIAGQASGIGSVDIRLSGSMVRYYGEAMNTADIYATHIGNGLSTGDLDGDGIEDLSFSYRYQGRGYAVILLGNTIYPGVPHGTSVPVHEGDDFDPDISIDLGTGGWQEASLSFAELDPDGMDDMIIGLPYASAYETFREWAGQVDIYKGRKLTSELSLSRTDANHTIYGMDSGDLFGELTLGLDMDSDGMDEILVTSPGGDGIRNQVPDCGEAFLFNPDVSFQRYMDQSDSVSFFRGISGGSGSFHAVASSEMIVDGYHELLVSTSSADVEENGLAGTGFLSMLSRRSYFDASFVGMFNSSSFGKTMVIDDFDRDGFQDFVIGDPLGGGSGRTGFSQLFFGKPGGWSGRYMASMQSDLSYNDAVEVSEFGGAMTSGDLNDDGYPDLVVGAPLAQIDGLYNDAGSIHVYWGGTRSYMENSPNLAIEGYLVERVGAAVAVGDLNGDGIDDLAFAAPYDTGIETLGRYHSGMVYIMFGPLSGTTIKSRNNYDVKIIGTMDNEFIGESLVVGDIDDDGIDDLVIGAPRSKAGSITRQGVTYILGGRADWENQIDLVDEPSVRLFGPWPYDEVGIELELGDIDADGKPELLLGTDKGDGYRRSVTEGGNTYILKGEYLASMLPKGNISLRNNYNVTISGDQFQERSGSGLGVGDLDGDGYPEVFIGAKGFMDPLSGERTGAVHVFPSGLFSDRLDINTSSLPVIYGFSPGDEAGDTIHSRDVNMDGRIDLLIGAPGADPLSDRSFPGGAYYWEGKDLFSLPIRASTVEIVNSNTVPAIAGRERAIMAPGEGPYIMKIKARSLGGYDEVEAVSMEVFSAGHSGSARLAYETSTGVFSMDASGDFEGDIEVRSEMSRGWNDGVQTWFVEFAVTVDWDMPEPTFITTSASGVSGDHTNYLNEEFTIDRLISLDSGSMIVTGPNGTTLPRWLNAGTGLMISNITVYHGISGEKFGEGTGEGLDIGLFRPGMGTNYLRIGTGVLNGSSLTFPVTVPGDGASGPSLDLRIVQTSIPEGSLWDGNVSITLNVDSVLPPPVSSFTLFPDGKEAGARDIDNDQIVEVYWEDVLDQGGSGISNYTVFFLDESGEEVQRMDYLEPGDLVQLPGGLYTVSMVAHDRAGNRGPFTNRSLLIDVDEPRFQNSLPGEGSWLNDDSNTFSIEVKDFGSGIDAKTAMYRIYRSDAETLGDWQRVNLLTTIPGGLRLNATAPQADGFGHYIQWMVSDLSGLTTVSLPYSYNMDTVAPGIEITGDMELMVGPSVLHLECYMEDSLSGLKLESISYRVGSASDFWDSSWKELGLTGAGASATPSIEILPGFRGWGYLQWSVSDVADNMVWSDLISIYIDDVLPGFTGFSPNGTTVLKKTEQEIQAFIEEDGSGLERSGVEYSVSTITGWIEYGVGGYSPWEQVAELEDSGYGLYTASIDVKLDEGPFNLVRFRVKDVAENGWVVSSPIKLEVTVTVSDLPPTALFNIIPATDFIYSGDSIILDGSPSSDPEGRNLSYSWYSDLERYPYGDSIGSGKVLNVSLEKVGTHRLWLMVTDGAHIVASEEQILVVQDREGSGSGDGGEDNGWDLMEILPYLILALLIGLLLGAIAVYIFMTRRSGDLAQAAGDVQPLVPARFESDYFVPHCPHCGADAKLSDEYCMKCGTVFSAEDRRRMEKEGKKKRKGSTGKKRSLPPRMVEEEIDEVFNDIPGDWEEEDPYDEETEEGELTEEDDLYEEDYEEDEAGEEFPGPGDEDLDEEEMENIDMDEIDDLEDMDIEEIDDDEWEVDK